MDPFLIVNLISDLGGECIVAREYHEDGGTHLHAFVDFGRKLRRRDATIFDIHGFHPNISPSRGNPEGGYDYAIKDGDIVAGGLTRQQLGECSEVSVTEFWHQAMEETDRDGFFALLERCAPKNLVLNFPAIQRYADWRYAEKDEEYSGPTSGFCLDQYEELRGWVENELECISGG